MRDNKALFVLALVAVLWSSGGLAIKLVEAHPLAIAGLRSALALLTLLAITRFRPGLTWSRTQILGGVCYMILLVTGVTATRLTTAANAILLAYTAPVYVALIAPRLLGEPTRRADWIMIAVVLGGMTLFFMDRLSAGGFWGNVLAVGTGAGYAGFTLCMRAQKDASPLGTACLGHGFSAILGLPFLLAAPWPDAASWAGFLYLGVIQQGVSLALYSWSIRRLNALTAIIVMTLEPILNPVWVAIGVGETPGPFALAGGIVVLTAVTVRGLRSARGA
ncbi:DMT family transporter [Desulfovibrio sp.]